MELGVRQIRTAGKGSGSVELTLPGELRHLVGLPCRITLHDGARPDIVLQPDLTPALAAFADLWRELTYLLAAGPAEHFPAASFCFGMHPRPGTLAGPYLCWQDGLALAAGAADACAVARTIAACATHFAADIEISAPLAHPFGAVCGYLATGCLAFPEWQEPCDIAASELVLRGGWCPGAAWQAAADTQPRLHWPTLAPGAAAAASLFAAWSLPGASYATLRAAWRRGRSIELNRG